MNDRAPAEPSDLTLPRGGLHFNGAIIIIILFKNTARIFPGILSGGGTTPAPQPSIRL